MSGAIQTLHLPSHSFPLVVGGSGSRLLPGAISIVRPRGTGSPKGNGLTGLVIMAIDSVCFIWVPAPGAAGREEDGTGAGAALGLDEKMGLDGPFAGRRDLNSIFESVDKLRSLCLAKSIVCEGVELSILLFRLYRCT